jgi:hypothetical protein
MLKPLAAMTAVALGVALLAPASAHAAKEKPDLPEIRTTVALDVSGTWSGRISFGLHTPGGQVREATRPIPVEVDLTKSACDLTGCMTTRLVIDSSADTSSTTRIPGTMRTATLVQASIPVTVQRIVDGEVVAEHAATISLGVRAYKVGRFIKVTTLTQDREIEVLTIPRRAAVRATVSLGGEPLTGAGEVSRLQIVD